MATGAQGAGPWPLPRGRRLPGTPSGRSEHEAEGGDLTDLGCPDCRGVLAIREVGKQGHLAFSCRVGHGFSGESLLRAKEEQLEDALWCAVEAYEEVMLLHEEMALRASANRLAARRAAYEQRLGRARESVATLRAIIAADAPAVPEPGDG